MSKFVLELGKKSKTGLVSTLFFSSSSIEGRKSYNKCYVQLLIEQGGRCIIDVFANPSGGPERLTHVTKILTSNLRPKTILRVDKARAYKGWVQDHPEVSNALMIMTF